MIEPNTIVAGDCIQLLGQELIPQADLAFAFGAAVNLTLALSAWVH